MNPTQATERFQVNRGVAHRQIAAFDQRITQLASEIKVFEVAFVEAAGGQQNHQWRFVVAGRLAHQRLLQGAEKARQVLHLQVAVHVRERARDDLPVFQRKTGPRGRLGTVGGYPPAAVGSARQIHSVHVQERAFGRFHALTRPQKIVMPEHQFRRQQAVGDQLLRTVQVGQYRIEQSRPLSDARSDVLPFLSRY